MNFFRMATGWKIFFFGTAAILFAVGLMVIIGTMGSGEPGLYFIPLLLWVVAVFLGCEAARMFVSIEDDAVVIRRAISRRRYPLEEIEGYRIGQRDAFFLFLKKNRRVTI